MKTRDFSFDLPDELIAQYPADRRGESRLLVLHRSTGEIAHRMVGDLPEFLPRDATLVLNDSRVRKARVYGSTPDGRQRELLFVRRTGHGSERESAELSAGLSAALSADRFPDCWSVMTRRPSRLAAGTVVSLPDGILARVTGHRGQLVDMEADRPLSESFFEKHGHVPLPPYVRREDEPADSERYQTVYAANPGSVAAPTAGLHLTDELLSRIRARGIDIVHVTLHVGIGTFLPVRTEHIDDHVMHEEEYQISPDAADRINAAREEGRPVVAVGTTCVRTLESAFTEGHGVVPGRRSTDLFIRPGFRFRVVTALVTNFHTPQSTLLMLVSAFAGRERILAAYRAAVDLRYRFFSYGDAMLIV